MKSDDTALGGERLAGQLARMTSHQTPPRNLDEAHLRVLLDHRPDPLHLPRSLLVLDENGQVTPAETAEWRRLLGPVLN